MKDEIEKLSEEDLKKMLLKLKEENALLKRNASLKNDALAASSSSGLGDSTDYFSGCNRYRLFFESMSVGGYFSTPEGRFLQVNPQMVRMLGYDNEEELLSLDITTQIFLNPHDRAAILDQVKTNEAITSVYQAKTRNGQIIWIEDHIRFIKDDWGNVQFIEGNCYDITSRQETEFALLMSEERFRILLDNMSEVFMLVDNNDRVLYVNKRFTDILGYNREEIIGQISYRVLVDPADFNVIVNANKDRTADKSGQYELYFRTKAGDKVLFLVNGAPYKDARGNVIGSIGTMTDITERKEAEYLLQKSQQLFQTLATISPVGIFRTDLKGKTTYVNPKWCELSGFTPEQAMGDNWLEAVHPDDRQLIMDGWKQHSSNGENSVAEYRFLREDGRTVWVMGFAVPEVERGKIKGYVGTITDISDRKIAEIELQKKSQLIEIQNEQYLRINEELIQLSEELNQAKLKAEESDQLKSAFLANMSHEIRTPLNGIIGFAHILSAFDLSETERKEYTATLHLSCNRLLNTVNDILDISKIDAGQTTVKPGEYNPIKLLRELFRLQEPNYQKKGVSLVLKSMESLAGISVHGDEQKVYQVINNLLDNALKFTPVGHVEFGASVKENRICYFVQDTGIGIARDQQDFVFGRFNQENITLSRAHEGSGLGLAITKGLVELMQGSITLESEKGKGSLFRINLPLSFATKTNDVLIQDLKRPEVNNMVKGPILVAEDDDVNFQLIYSILRTGTSDQIFRAVNGTEAIDAMVHNPQIELVLMDIKMPGVDGFEAIRRIRSLNAHVPVIVISAFTNGGEEQKACEAGCNGFIAKPYNPTTLIGRINDIAGRQQASLR